MSAQPSPDGGFVVVVGDDGTLTVPAAVLARYGLRPGLSFGWHPLNARPALAATAVLWRPQSRPKLSTSSSRVSIRPRPKRASYYGHPAIDT